MSHQVPSIMPAISGGWWHWGVGPWVTLDMLSVIFFGEFGLFLEEKKPKQVCLWNENMSFKFYQILQLLFFSNFCRFIFCYKKIAFTPKKNERLEPQNRGFWSKMIFRYSFQKGGFQVLAVNFGVSISDSEVLEKVVFFVWLQKNKIDHL